MKTKELRWCDLGADGRQAHRSGPFGFQVDAFPLPEQGLKYLASYTHRVAISNQRLLSLEDGRVTFEWKGYAPGSQTKTMTLDAVEFIHRLLLHVLPSGFVHIRHFGFLAQSQSEGKTGAMPVLTAYSPNGHRNHCGYSRNLRGNHRGAVVVPAMLYLQDRPVDPCSAPHCRGLCLFTGAHGYPSTKSLSNSLAPVRVTGHPCLERWCFASKPLAPIANPETSPSQLGGRQ